MKFSEIREIAKKERSWKSGFKQSGILLEDWVEKNMSQLKRLPPQSSTDFTYNGIGIDIKGCWASEYNNNIYIEAVQNVKLNSIPSHIKNSNILLLYIDYQTGISHIINWKKLYLSISSTPTTSGGYNSKGWIVNLDSLVKDGFAVKLLPLEATQKEKA